jgi:hypothetical protein
MKNINLDEPHETVFRIMSGLVVTDVIIGSRVRDALRNAGTIVRHVLNILFKKNINGTANRTKLLKPR